MRQPRTGFGRATCALFCGGLFWSCTHADAAYRPTAEATPLARAAPDIEAKDLIERLGVHDELWRLDHLGESWAQELSRLGQTAPEESAPLPHAINALRDVARIAGRCFSVVDARTLLVQEVALLSDDDRGDLRTMLMASAFARFRLAEASLTTHVGQLRAARRLAYRRGDRVDRPMLRLAERLVRDTGRAERTTRVTFDAMQSLVVALGPATAHYLGESKPGLLELRTAFREDVERDLSQAYVAVVEEIGADSARAVSQMLTTEPAGRLRAALLRGLDRALAQGSACANDRVREALQEVVMPPAQPAEGW